MIAVLGQALLRRTLVLSTALKPGENHVALREVLDAGGDGLLSAGALHRLGIPVSLLACLGMDDQGVRVRKQLKEFGLSTKTLLSSRDLPTTTELQVIGLGEDRPVVSRFYVPGAGDSLGKNQIREALKWLKDCPLLLVDGSLPLETLDYVGTVKELRPITKVLHLSPIKPLFLEEPPAWMKGYQIVVLSLEDLKKFAQRDLNKPLNAQDSAREMSKLWQQPVVVYLDGLGVISADQKSLEYLPGVNLEVQDAGNLRPGFLAGLLAGLWLEQDLLASLTTALRLSALGAHNPGGLEAFPTLHALHKFQEDFFKEGV